MAATSEERKELFIRYAKDSKQRFITALYTVEPTNPDIDYTRMCFKTEDIPFLRITRMATYNEDEMYGGRILNIQYLHYKGLALDLHPEVGTLPQEWIDNKAVERGYFDLVTPESVKYQSYDCIRAVKEPTTHMFTNTYSLGKSNSIQYEKVSSIPLQLDMFKKDGFYVEYPAETKIYGLVLKGGLEIYDNAEGIIMAIGSDPEVLKQLDTSEINIDQERGEDARRCVVREVLAINWLGKTKTGFQFYAVQNQHGCEGIIYTDKTIDPNDDFISSNPIEMNIIYPDGILNA
jgi:hypothetical protein